MSDAHSVVDQRLPLPCRIPTVYIGSAGFQLQRCRHAIPRLKLIIARLLAVFVQIDKSGRNHEALRINRLLALQRLTRNRSDLASADSYIPHRVESRLWIHHSSIRDDDVVGRVLRHNVFLRAHAKIHGEQRSRRNQDSDPQFDTLSAHEPSDRLFGRQVSSDRLLLSKDF